MAYLDSPWMVCILTLVHLTCLVSALLARRSQGSRRQTSYERLFLGCLALIGLVLMLSLLLGPAFWMSAGATLAVMVLAAIWDFEPNARIHQRTVEQSI